MSVDNIKMDLGEIDCGVVYWLDLAQDGDQWMVLVNTLMNLQVPYIAGKFLSSFTIGGMGEIDYN
jgi:hypothetical protein